MLTVPLVVLLRETRKVEALALLIKLALVALSWEEVRNLGMVIRILVVLPCERVQNLTRETVQVLVLLALALALIHRL